MWSTHVPPNTPHPHAPSPKPGRAQTGGFFEVPFIRWGFDETFNAKVASRNPVLCVLVAVHFEAGGGGGGWTTCDSAFLTAAV